MAGDVLSVPPVQSLSAFDGIGVHIPQRVKQKIWDGEYFDLGILLMSTHEMEASEGGSGQLCFEGGETCY